VISFLFDYATPSAFESDRERARIGFTADARRPVRLHARIAREALSVRLALQALGELIWSNDSWIPDGGDFLLDPIVTVHPDRVFFEAFSQDQSAYGLVVLDRAIFAPEGEVVCGTTNVDFTSWLWAALAEMRSRRETWFRIGAEGFEVRTEQAGGRFERKVDVPEDWVRGFLQLQSGMALPGTRLRARAVDLLAAIRFLRFTKAKMSPRALRYEMEPGQDARVVLEPWEQVIRLRGADHSYAETRTIRTWGRRRLKLIEPLLPYADEVEIFLKGRALPSFYAVPLPGVTFVLGLSGWTENRWTGAGALAMLGPRGGAEFVEHAIRALREAPMDEAALAARLGVPRQTASAVLSRLVRRGRAVYDVQRREFRHRELFAEPIDEARLYPVEPHTEEARAFQEQGKVRVTASAPRETRKVKSLKTPEGRVTREIVHRDWSLTGAVADQPEVEAVLDDGGRLIFGRCGCAFFRENVLNLGPCAHLLALVWAGEALRRDQPTSVPGAAEDAPPSRRREADEDDEAGEGEPAEDEEE